MNMRIIKCMYWNMHGVKSKIVGNKLANQDFLDIISQYDVIGLGELHTEEEIAIPGFHLVKQTKRKKVHKGPKIAGGIAVLVKHDIMDSFNIEKNNNGNSIRVSLTVKSYFGFYYYSPPKKDDNFFPIIQEEIQFFQNKGQIYVFGDFNARVAIEIDFIEQDKYDLNYGLQNPTNIPKSNSYDNKINARGKEIIDLCKINDVIIVNGRKLGDIFGNVINGMARVWLITC